MSQLTPLSTPPALLFSFPLPWTPIWDPLTPLLNPTFVLQTLLEPHTQTSPQSREYTSLHVLVTCFEATCITLHCT